MSILDKLFPRRGRPPAPIPSAEIAAEIERRTAARAAAQARIGAAASQYKAALDALDEAGMAEADEEKLAAERSVTVTEHAIHELRKAHTEALQVERREAFRTDVAAATRQGETVQMRLETEYDGAAAALASILKDLADYYDLASALRHRAREFGESINLPAPQSFRAAPRRWRASWPNPEGSHLGTVRGDAKDAPRGSIRWIDNEPVPARDGVTVEPRPVEGPESILEVIRQLPALRHGEAIHWPRPVPAEKFEPRGYIDQTRPRKYAPVPALVPSPHDDPRRESER